MAGIIGNYIFAYGFITEISDKRYFKNSTHKSDMAKIKIKEPWKPYLNPVGWYRLVEPDEQTKLYVFGERIRSVEDNTLVYFSCYADNFNKKHIYKLNKDVLKMKIKDKEFIDREASLHKDTASILLFMNDKELADY